MIETAPDLRGKTCLVTGASTGIGRETARGLARLGARVLLLGRDPRRLEVAYRDIARSTGSDALDTVECDLASQRQIREAAAAVTARHPRLAVLVNNAGIITSRRSLTEDGIETQFAVNHLAPFLLTHLLMRALRAAAPARVVTVASAVETLGRIDFADLNGERRYDGNTAYCQSKLANVLFTYELARRVPPAEVTANCLHPGAIATGLLADYFGYSRVWSTVARLKYPGPSRGAQTSVYLASAPEVTGVTGSFFEDGSLRASSPASMDATTQLRLWTVSERLARLSDHERLADASRA